MVERALLVPDDAEHRVTGLAVGRRANPRVGQLLGEFVGAVFVQKSVADLDTDFRVGGVGDADAADSLAEPIGDFVGVRFRGRGAVQCHLVSHVLVCVTTE